MLSRAYLSVGYAVLCTLVHDPYCNSNI